MSGRELLARCPAKINLWLRVLGRRPDGYHELDTLFQTIDVWDELRIEPCSRLSLDCDDPALPVDRSNLVLRAAELLGERYPGRTGGARLTLRKRIPVQAGLGGGSSDGAAALLLCRRFWGLPASDAELAGLAGLLGADVPFFLTGGTARGTGRGDRIEPLPFGGEMPVLLGLPPFGISTAEVFSRLDTRLTLPGNGVSLPVLSAHKWPVENDFRSAVNDLEGVVFEARPELARFRDALLREGARSALLSGSGAAVYGLFGDDREQDSVAERLRGRFPSWRLVGTRTVQGAAQVVTALE
jgi:4-diphosphocytidyl-2-C-methyl-D-erythritol kinase